MLTIEEAKKLRNTYAIVRKHESVIDEAIRQAVIGGKTCVQYTIEDDMISSTLLVGRYLEGGWLASAKAFEPDRVGQPEVIYTITITFPPELT